ncbi:MAG: NAD(P)-dependent oxidoreductase [Verrucomicrobiae bacterium]|nr:NAD(P)-dependent oxidoreductase [Verrucomicrobiae bacterium]
MKRILVTGATGFIGRAVLPLLAREGWEIQAVSSRIPSREADGIHWRQCDLLNLEDARKLVKEAAATHWLHLAWYVKPGQYWNSPENFRWVTATLAMAEAFQAAGGKRLVAAGTCAEYDWNYGYCREDITPLTPGTVYGKSKNLLQQMLAAYGEARNLEVAWGRIFNLYGPHENMERLVPMAIHALLRGEPVPCTHGGQIRDFLHVDDVASAFVQLVSSTATGAFNVASNVPVAIRDILAVIAGRLSGQNLLRPGMMPAAADDPPLVVGDNRRLCSLGWKPGIGLESGIAQTVQWWKDRSKTAPDN